MQAEIPGPVCRGWALVLCPVSHSCHPGRGRISGLLAVLTADLRRDLVQPRELCGHLSSGD